MNLSLSENGQEGIRSTISSTPQPDQQQRVHSVERRRLDEHGDDGPVHSDSAGSPPGRENVPAVQHEADDDHEGEEDIKRNRNRKVRETEVDGGGD